ncbi:MAG: ABC transporter permease subunit [Ruthenibacterium lactatiformans]
MEQGFIYALVALGLYISFRTLDIADLTTDGTFTLGAAVSAVFTVQGQPLLGVVLAFSAAHWRGLSPRFCDEAGRAAYSGGYHHHDGAVFRQPDGDGKAEYQFL